MALAGKQGRRSSLRSSQTTFVFCLCGIDFNWSKADSEQRMRKEGRKEGAKISAKRGGQRVSAEKYLPLLDNKRMTRVSNRRPDCIQDQKCCSLLTDMLP